MYTELPLSAMTDKALQALLTLVRDDSMWRFGGLQNRDWVITDIEEEFIRRSDQKVIGATY